MSPSAALAIKPPTLVARVAPAAAAARVVMFGSAAPVTCAVMDYACRLCAAVNSARPGYARIEIIEPDRPLAFVAAIASALRAGAVAHLQLPIEGWGNSVVPGSALFAARALTRQGRVAITLHEWTSLNALRYLSMIPDVVASDGFVFVSPRQRDAFQRTPWAGGAKKAAAPVIPIGPNIMPARIDPARVAAERAKLRGVGDRRAELIVGFFGVLYASKRPELLLQATAALHRRGVKARLLICGDFLIDKPRDRDAFLALARALNLTDWLDFRGRVEDEGELMATLLASDVFLLPYSDGVSLRRGSFQAVSQLAVPLVTTTPECVDEFDAVPDLKAKIESAATVLCAADAAPEAFALALVEAASQKRAAFGVALDSVWREAAERHLAFYDGLVSKRSAS
jgi:glycosyltransferase involved in cell wall biosynthesis